MTEQQEIHVILGVPMAMKKPGPAPAVVKYYETQIQQLVELIGIQKNSRLLEILQEQKANMESSFAAYLEQFDANTGPWFPPSGIYKAPPSIQFSISGAEGVDALVKELAGKEPEATPLSDREQRIEAVMDELGHLLDDPATVTIPAHLMERVERLTNFSIHGTQEVVNMALHDFLTKTGH